MVLLLKFVDCVSMNNTASIVAYPDLGLLSLFETSTINLIFIIPVVILYMVMSLYIAHKKVLHKHTITIYNQKNSENVDDV